MQQPQNNSSSSHLIGLLAVFGAIAFAVPVLAAALFFLWGVAGRAWHFALAGF